MNAKATRMLFAAVALSALAALVASSAQARIPEGNGTKPPAGTVVKEQRGGTLAVTDEICVALDRAIRVAIPQCSHASAVKVARADTGAGASAEPDKRCYGQLVSGINTTWPWAHFDKEAFPPPPGAVALWVQLFGADIGVNSVRELQLYFCGG